MAVKDLETYTPIPSLAPSDKLIVMRTSEDNTVYTTTVSEFTGSVGGGDMLVATYDPTGVEADAFDVDNHASGSTNKVYTATEQSKLAAIEASADVTDATNVAAAGAVMEGDTTTASMSFVLDEDDMSSNSATKLATQQSIKKYVDDNIGGGGGATELSDLTDVGVTTPTSGNALMADGDSWESRALVEADISDFGTYADASHTHTESDITDLGSYSVTGHTHTESDITDLGAYLTSITGEDLADLSDVVITSVANNEVLAYDTGGNWINQTASEAGLSEVGHTHTESEISDFGSYAETGHTHTESDITDLGSYAAASHTHVEADITDLGTYLEDITGENLTDLGDVVITTPADNEVLAYDSGGNWINQTPTEAGLAEASHSHTESDITDLGTYLEDITGESIEDLSNVTITTPADNEVLAWNGTDTWINQTPTEAGLAEASHTHTESDITDLGSYMENPMTTEGDIIVGGTSGAAGRLGIGAEGYVVTSVSGVPAWAASTGGISDVVEDTTPQLGGDLDLNGHGIDFPSTPNITDVLDEDDLSSDSATKLATQQSIKAYVDSFSYPTGFSAVVAPSGGDYTTLGAALTAGETSIFVKEGTYSESAITPTSDNVTIMGESRKKTIIDMQSNAFDASLLVGWIVKNITFKGSSTINLGYPELIEDCHFSNVGTGSFLKWAGGVAVNNYITTETQSSGDLFSWSGSHATFQGNTIFCSAAPGSGVTAIKQWTTITRCIFSDNYIYCRGDTDNQGFVANGTTLDHMVFSGNQFYGPSMSSGTSVAFDMSATGSNSSDLVISGNYFSDWKRGLHLEGVFVHTVTGNQIAAIECLRIDSCSHVNVTGNLFASNNVAGSYGVHITGAASDDVSVVSNTFHRNDVGIDIDSGCERTIVGLNKYGNGVDTQITDDGTDTIYIGEPDLAGGLHFKADGSEVINMESDIDMTAKDLYDVATVTFESEHDNGNSSTADTVDWNNGQKQKSTLTGDCTYTFTAPAGPGNFLLKVIQDGTGSRTVTWPATVKWPGGTAPTLTTDANAVDLVSFYWDGTNYFGNISLDFSVPA